MPPQITVFFQRFGAGLKSFTTGQRTLAVIGAALLVVGVVALSAWLSKPHPGPAVLRPQGAPMRAPSWTSSARTTCPTSSATAARPSWSRRTRSTTSGSRPPPPACPTAAATGYSLLDKMGVTSSEFQQSVTYKRALEGELASTISAMDGVKTAAVRLAIPEKTVFVSKTPDTTASVFVETAPGVTLSGDKVQAIVHLTSAAIENLKPANVSVVDSQGNVLSTVGGGAAGSTSKQAVRLPAAHRSTP